MLAAVMDTSDLALRVFEATILEFQGLGQLCRVCGRLVDQPGMDACCPCRMEIAAYIANLPAERRRT